MMGLHTTNFKPMLSATLETMTSVDYPVLVSPKLDGIRCIIMGGVAVSRNLKPIPNKFVQEILGRLPDGIDGELIVGPPVGNDVWNRTTAGVMREDGYPEFRFHVFDMFDPAKPAQSFFDRLSALRDAVGNSAYCKVVPQHLIQGRSGLEATEDMFVRQGYEGVMLRDPRSTYKYGRSTLREFGLVKLKRWFDAEATITGFVERMANNNEATTDALGRTKRSTHKANKTGRGDLGALVCEFQQMKKTSPVEFELGTGFNDAVRRTIWNNQESYIGRTVTFKYQALTPDGIPRFPVFLRFRGEE